MALDYLQARNVRKKIGQVVAGEILSSDHQLEDNRQQMADAVMSNSNQVAVENYDAQI